MRNCIQVMAAVVVVVIMAVCTGEDICRKQIHTRNLALFIPANFLLAWCSRNEWKMMAAGAVLGIIFFVISICTEEKIGKGDAVLIIGMGINLGFWTALVVVFLALCEVCIYGLIFLRKRKGWSYEIAFVPFLLVPYVSAVIWQLYYSNLAV